MPGTVLTVKVFWLVILTCGFTQLDPSAPLPNISVHFEVRYHIGAHTSENMGSTHREVGTELCRDVTPACLAQCVSCAPRWRAPEMDRAAPGHPSKRSEAQDSTCAHAMSPGHILARPALPSTQPRRTRCSDSQVSSTSSVVSSPSTVSLRSYATPAGHREGELGQCRASQQGPGLLRLAHGFVPSWGHGMPRR